MRGSIAAKFPQLRAFLPQRLSAVHADQGKLGAFRHHSGLTAAQAKQALTKFNSFPTIEVWDLGLGTNGNPAMGRFDPEFRNSVAIARDVAERFEIDFSSPTAQETIEAVVLHEMVHWGDFFDDSQESGDPGLRFELEVYQEWHGRWFDAAPSPAVLAVADGSRFVFPITGQIGGGTAYWGRNIRSNGSRSHHGIDIFNEIGTPVHAIADGRILQGRRFRSGEPWVSQTGNYGQMVDIDHGNGLVSRYAHLNTVEVMPGPVRQGARIGTLGASGTEWGAWLAVGQPGGSPPVTASRPHLHFEIRNAAGQAFGNFDDTFDPASFFDFIAAGKDARNTAVTVLQPGRTLEQPVAAIADPAVEIKTGTDAIPVGHRTAYPNRTYSPDDPRGLRNNNPGNLRKDGTEWAGLRTADLQLDTAFYQFIAMEWGIRAMARVLRTYRDHYGIRTLRAMSARWAPFADHNDPVRHAQNVLANAPGVANSIDMDIDLADPAVAFGVVRGIAVAENGRKADTISDDIVQRGIDLESSA
ncbi:MAG: peptidoglycan DD-metalloendopeptidase family protein [Alphaproteobacteria bacterium]